MRAEITIRQIFYNHSLLNFFFRTQAENTFNELFDAVSEDYSEVFDSIENYSDDLDEVEEMFYNDSIEEICDALGLTMTSKEDEDSDL